MAYKFTKAEAYSRTNKIVVEIPETFESQFLFNHLNKIGSYEGQNYYNSFDVYEVGNVRFLYGNFPRDNKAFSSKLLKEVGLKSRDIWNNAFHNDIYISSETRVNEIKKLAEDFATSIEKGIHDPGPIKSFVSYKRNLCEQKDFFPDKSLLKIASELIEEIEGENSVEIKNKINEGLNKIISSLSKDMNQQPYDIQLNVALNEIYNNEKLKQKNKNIEVKGR